MLAAPKRSKTPLPAWLSTPVLQNGDCLKSKEFLRRYEAMPELKKAELIEGKVYMGSPVSAGHAEQDAIIQGWLTTYAASTPGVNVYANGTVILDPDNTVQPDAMLCIKPGRGGGTRLNEKDLLEGAPELIVEIAVSTESIDLGEKRDAYARNGVQEYLVWRTRDRAFDWFVLENELYEAKVPDSRGILRSAFFGGLDLDVAALLRLDSAQVLARLQRGIASPAHSAFVRKLR